MSFSINQKVWIIKRNYTERGYGMSLVESEPFKVVELRVVNIEAKAGYSDEDDYLIYRLAEKIGYKPEINDLDHGLQGLTEEFKEEHVYDSFDLAVMGIIEMIDERLDELQEIKGHYLNMLEKYYKDQKEKGLEWLKQLDEIDNALSEQEMHI